MGQRNEFTTFFNAVGDPAAERAIDRFVDTQVRGFSRISQAAAQASSAASGILQRGGGVGGTAAVAAASRALQTQATESRNVAAATLEVARVTPLAATAQRRQTVAALEGAQANSRLAQSLSAAATALTVVQGPLGPIAGRFGAASRAIGSLGAFTLGAAAAGVVASGVIRLGNAYTVTEAKLRPFFETQNQVNQAMAQVVGIANRSRQSLEATADLYGRLTQNAANYNIAQSRIGRITEISAKAAALSGGTAQSQEAGLYQFAQAIGSNRLGGDELRSILENTSQLANAIAQGMGVTVGQLRNLGAQGVLTTQIVVSALERAGHTVDERFAKLPLTLGAASQAFTNNLEVMVGRFDRSIGLSSGLAHAILAVGNNLHGIVSIAAGVGTAFAAIKVGNWVGGLVTARENVVALNTELTGLIQTEAREAAAEQKAAADAIRLREARIVAIREEKAAIEANILAQAEQLAAARAALAQNAFRVQIGRPVSGASQAVAMGDEAAAIGSLRALQTDLATTKQRLAAASVAEAEAESVYTAATVRSTEATANQIAVEAESAASKGLLATGFSRVIGAVFSWQTALIVGTAALIEYATSQSASERITDQARAAMDAYAASVDQATGKVEGLSDAERRRRVRSERDIVDQANQGGRNTPAVADPFNVNSTANQLAGRLAAAQTLGEFGHVGDQHFALQISGIINSLGRDATSTANAIRVLQAASQTTHPELRQFVADNQDLIDSLKDITDAAAAAEARIRGYQGALDPAVVTRMAVAQAQFAAELPLRLQAVHQASVNENTLNDNARLQNNLNDVAGAVGNSRFGRPILTPTQLEAQARAIHYFETEGRVANATAAQITNYNRAHQQLIRQHQEDVRASQEVMPQLMAEARFRTQQQTAQRDSERAQAAQRRAEAAQRRAQAEQERQQNLMGRRTDILGRYTPEPSQQQKAEAAIRDLQDIQRHLGQGLYPQAAMEADVARIRGGLNRELTTTLNQHRDAILGRYQDEPRRVVRAGLDINTLRQQQQLLGEGVYPRATMEADIARINEGVLKPFRDINEQAARQRAEQALILQGRQAEAAALTQAFQLYEQIGQVSEAQYAILVRNAEYEQRINDVLASRERMVTALQGSVEEVRTGLEQALLASTDLTHAPAAFGNFLQAQINRVQQIGIQSFVERITAGADERVRGLLSARGAVDAASRTLAAQLGDAGETGLELANSNRRAGEIMVTAASDFAARIQAINVPTTVGAGTGADAANLAAWQNAGSGPAGLGLSPAARVVAAAISRRENLQLPFSLSSLSSGFGPRARPTAGASTNHPGLDFAQPYGTPVPAALSGIVVPTTAHGLGNAVTIDSGHGLQELYGHLSRLNVTIGQLVHQGEIIGQVGSTGISTGNHLHFGISQNGVALDPRLHLGSRLIEVAAGGVGGLQPIQAEAPTPSVVRQSAQEAADAMMADQLAAMRRAGISTTAGALGAFDTVPRQTPAPGHIASAREAYNAIGASVGQRLDNALGTKFFKGIGGSFGTALEGAGQGAIASGFAKAIGITQSKTGAEIGGAIGSLIPQLGPFGGIIGGLIGGTIGGLFSPTKKASTTISFNPATGGLSNTLANSNNRDYRLAATAAGGTIINSLTDIAHQLYGSVGNFGSLSIGQRKDKYVVDPTGSGRTKGSGTYSFSSEQEAVAKALELAISRGAIQGISKASQNILKSGQDLQTAVSKAAIIEGIPRTLLERTNPVLAAVTELNQQFVYTIQILKEAGATGEQFAQAQKLYDLQRADAVKQASDVMFGAITKYLQEMTSGSSSPLNKLTVYQNAKSELDKFEAQIKTGLFNQDDLTAAAKNFQDAARAYEGSGSAFFQDFDYIFSLLSQAKASAQGLSGAPADLPASPFAGDATIQALIDQFNGQTSAIDNQTNVLSGLLGNIYDVLAGGDAGSATLSTIHSLPAFSGLGGSQPQ